MHVFTSIYIKVTSTHARIRLRRCVQIATRSVPYFRSFTAPKPTRTNWQLHFYIYRYLCSRSVSVTGDSELLIGMQLCRSRIWCKGASNTRKTHEHSLCRFQLCFWNEGTCITIKNILLHFQWHIFLMTLKSLWGDFRTARHEKISLKEGNKRGHAHAPKQRNSHAKQ
jgi:hypothetical protein